MTIHDSNVAHVGSGATDIGARPKRARRTKALAVRAILGSAVGLVVAASVPAACVGASGRPALLADLCAPSGCPEPSGADVHIRGQQEAGATPADDERVVRYRQAVVDGLRLFYREAGSRGRPVIVLLHGWPSSSHMYRDLIPLLAPRFHVIAPDYPGFGNSDAPAPEMFEYSFDHLAAVILQLLTRLELERYSLYMHDYGAPVGLRVAERHPERIEALIIQNGNSYTEGLSPAGAPLFAYWKSRNAATEGEVRKLLHRGTTEFQYLQGAHEADRISPDAWALDQALLDRPGNDRIQLELLYDYRKNVERYPAWQAYFRKQQPPTLVVWGRNDPFFTVEGALAYKRDLQDLELHLLDAGHFALEEEHARIAQLITEFMGRCVGDTSRRR